MPYVEGHIRPHIRPHSDLPSVTEGELNYQLTVLIIEYILHNGLNYERIGDVQGALRNCGVEFDRRVTSIYEDSKIKQNGDVYDALVPLLPPKEQTTLGGVPHAQNYPAREAKDRVKDRRGSRGDDRRT